jgi:hypothetical protein
LTSKHDLHAPLIELAWCLWSELGLSGWGRRHEHWLVDPEPLIIFTAWLGDGDARLRNESTDWCVQFAPMISATRLSNLQAGTNEATRQRLRELASVVSMHSSVRWKLGDATEAAPLKSSKHHPFVPTGRSRLESLHGGSRLALRLRAILGVGARSEIVRTLLEPKTPPRTAADLAEETAFRKRYLASALEMLQRGGVVDGEKVRKEIRFRLDRTDAWRELVGETPTVWPRWIHILPLLTDVVDLLERVESISSRLQAVELHRAAETLVPRLKKARLIAPRGSNLADGLRPWFENVTFELAHANVAVFDEAHA